MRNLKKWTKYLIILGTVSILLLIIVLFIKDKIQADRTAKIKLLNEKIIIEKTKLDKCETELTNYKSVDYYKSKKDSLQNIIDDAPKDEDEKEIIENIKWKRNSIDWYLKSIPRKRNYTNKKRQGLSLGYWEEEYDADIENVEVEEGKPIEKLLIRDRKMLKEFKNEYKNYKRKKREWVKNYNLKDLKEKQNETQMIIDKIDSLNKRYAWIKGNINKFKTELKSIE